METTLEDMVHNMAGADKQTRKTQFYDARKTAVMELQ